MSTQLFNESLDLSEAQIDSERRQIQGVVLIRAGMSKNRRYYSDSVLQAAVPVFEGAKAYADHGKGARSIRDVSGWYTNVAYREGKLMADRAFSRTQAGNDAWAIAEDIVSGRAPSSLAGLSINAIGTGQTKKFDDGDGLNVESITAAQSVDDVDNAAAGGSYREDFAGGGITQLFWEKVTFDEFFASRPDYIKRIQNEMKTARQDDALKAAKAEAESAQAALQEAQNELDSLKSERDAIATKETAVRLELTIEQTLNKVNLPTEWRASLRETLLKADVSTWAAIIENEKQKAKSAGLRTPVIGSGQQVNEPLQELVKPSVKAPYDMDKLNTPEALIRALQGQ